MASMEDRLLKLREERIAREKARIEKLRELNLKKYSKNDQLPKNNTSNIPVPVKSKSDTASQAPTKSKSDTVCIKNNISIPKSNLKRPSTVPSIKRSTNKDTFATKSTTNHSTKTTNKVSNYNNNMKNVVVSSATHNIQIPVKVTNGDVHDSEPISIITKASEHQSQSTSCVQIDITQDEREHIAANSLNNDKPLIKATGQSHNNIIKNGVKISEPTKRVISKGENGNKIHSKNNLTVRKTAVFVPKDSNQSKVIDKKKSLHEDRKVNLNGPRQSVFDRLSKPKMVTQKVIDRTLKPKTDDTSLKHVIKDSQLITNKRRTLFDQKRSVTIRRSVSAVHFKRVPKSELNNCVHKWASIGEEIDKEHLENLNEDACIKGEQIISAIKSERKKVKFQTPLPNSNFNTPRPEEMRRKLQNWLQNRGKSSDSYHHLQCFGINHLSSDIRPLHWDTPRCDDDENKENIAFENDSDNESYLENNNRNGNLGGQNNLTVSAQKWRRASNMTDMSELNESYNTTLTSGEGIYYADELLMGALNDLTELLREGFDWEQCARWLRALRERFPSAPNTAPYWECRAALEERRGDLHATVHCLEQAIAKGTEQSVVEANLDNLLDKFMQLKISPNGGRKQADPKLLDIKNVFKSTIIRFAVQQAKLSQSVDTPKFTVTPVRRSSRLSRNHTPVRVYSTIHQTEELGAEFKPNKALPGSP